MTNAIFTALSEDVPNMLLTLLLISLLVIWLQSKFNKEFGGLRKEITDGNAALREDIGRVDKDLRNEIAEGNKDLREEIGDVSKRLARIEGKLDLLAYPAKTRPGTKAG